MLVVRCLWLVVRSLVVVCCLLLGCLLCLLCVVYCVMFDFLCAVVCGYLFAVRRLPLVVRCAFLLVRICCLFSLVVRR